MSIISARIDNRLLHGIVATQWAPFIGAQRVMVIDDHIASDPLLKSGMQMGKPAGCALSIITEQTAYTNFAAGKYNNQTVFVIVQNPEILKHLMDQGEKIPRIVLGGTVAPEEGVEAVQVSRRAFVTKAEEPVYQALAAGGASITVQYVPKDKEEKLSQYISNV
ncbi:MAG: PTS sugar transporter subunit IIB [Lachnospiraceae bacterium]|nr:PTS sugar transporter subunit IIB [Lachnospiraceae bacterium]MCD8131606.1 PTS sugar transporter subunit IIB [Lachnospiraceae bacterium]